MLRFNWGIILSFLIVIFLITSNSFDDLVNILTDYPNNDSSIEITDLPDSLLTNESSSYINAKYNKNPSGKSDLNSIGGSIKYPDSVKIQDSSNINKMELEQEAIEFKNRVNVQNSIQINDIYPNEYLENLIIPKPNTQISLNYENSPYSLNNKNIPSTSNVPKKIVEAKTSGSKSLYEQDLAGGSWVDSFEDDSGIGYEYNIYHRLGDISLRRFSYIPNGDFEEGTVGQIPDNWTYHTWNTGTGGKFQVNVKQNNTQFYTGNHCMYGYVKGDEGTIGGYRQYLNVTTKSFINVSGARYVYIFMRDIKEYHPYSWGWTNFITLQYFDGVNKHRLGTFPNFLYYSGQYAGSANNYDFSALGADGQTWYAYKREIPKTINTSNFNLTIIWYANDWTTTIGKYSEISSVVDNVYLENDPYGIVISKPINKPKDMIWDTIIINKTQAKNNYINITILNASDDQVIPGTPIYIDDGEFDISYIDPLKYPSLKLKANITRNLTSAPILHYWGVSWNVSTAWRDSLFGGLKGTSQSLINGDGEIRLRTSPTEWYKYQNNPILNEGPTSSWDDNGVAKASVLFNGDRYRMWYEGRSSDNSWQIGLATSKDGISWTKHSGNPVLKKGPSSTWDESRTGGPCVLFDGNTYKMWYQGMDKMKSFKIGYATSMDGINWKKYSKNPILDLGVSGSWDEGYVSNPKVYFDGITYKMWFNGRSLTTQNYKIGYATSYDGINWTKYSKNPVIVGSSGFSLGVKRLSVLPKGNSYLGWYSSNSGSGGEIHHATSSDGIKWNKYINNPILQKGQAGVWDDSYTALTEVFKKDYQYNMFYTGGKGLSAQIGLAKSKFSSYGMLNSTDIPLPKYQVFDQLILNKTEPNGTYINISIIDPSTNKTIPAFKELRNSIVNISFLNELNITSIRLIAYFSSNQKTTPILHNWAVTWRPLPKLNISADGPYFGYEGVPVNFKANCSTKDYLLRFEYSWDFDYDGTYETSWSVSPICINTWSDDCTCLISVKIRDNFGRTATDDTLLFISNLSPSVSAGPDQIKNESTTVYFKGFFFDPGTLDTHTIYWDFGDGNTSSGSLTTSHYYPQAGIYNVTLTVKDDDGGIGIDNLTLLVLNVEPVVIAGDDIYIDEGKGFSFNGTILNPGNDSLDYYWDFDISVDGPDLDNIFDNDIDSKVLNASHVYLDNNTYIAKLTVIDDENTVVTDYVNIIVNDLAPTAMFNYSPEPQDEGAPVQFNDSSLSYPDEIISWYWEFGDGGNSTEQNPIHIYADNSIFRVNLTVTDDDGSKDFFSYNVTIINVAPTANAGKDKEGFEVASFTFQGSCTDPGVLDTHTYEWDFNYDSITFNVDATGQSVPHTWIDDFDGYVALRVTDDDGEADIDSCRVIVKNVLPKVKLKILPIDVNISVRIAGEKWHDVVVDLYENNILIGNGSLTRYPSSPNDQMLHLSTLKANFSRVYSAILRYTPEDDTINGKPNGATPCWVIIKYQDRTEVRLHHTFNVKHPKTYTWKVNLTKELHYRTLTFEAEIYDPGADDLTFHWDFGDGTNITKFYPNQNRTFPVKRTEKINHLFQSSGTFTVTLTVKDDDGGIAIIKTIINIR